MNDLDELLFGMARPFLVVGAMAWAVVLWRAIRGLLSHVRVRHPDGSGVRARYPLVRISSGRWAVWPVFDDRRSRVLRFEKARWALVVRPVQASLDEYNEYRDAQGLLGFGPEDVVGQPPGECDGGGSGDERAGTHSEAHVRQALEQLLRGYRAELVAFLARQAPLVLTSSLLLVAGLAFAAKRFVPGVAAVQPSWLGIVGIALVATLPLLWLTWPRRPRHADAVLELVVREYRRGLRARRPGP